jgi:hypothetical protein
MTTINLDEHADDRMAALIAAMAMPKRLDAIRSVLPDLQAVDAATINKSLTELRELQERIVRRLS